MFYIRILFDSSGLEMGEISRTIKISAPSEVIYNIIKNQLISGWEHKYCNDLLKGAMTKYEILQDIPNYELHIKWSSWRTKKELRYLIRPNGEGSEVTIIIKYKLAFDIIERLSFVNSIGELLILEKAFQYGNKFSK